LAQEIKNQMIFRFIIVIGILFIFGFRFSNAQTKIEDYSAQKWVDSLQTISQYVKEHLAELTPREMKKQTSIRRAFQQRGYTNVLYDVLNQDGLGALISFITLNLHIEYSMPHKVFWIYPADPRSGFPGIPFPDDWSFPSDPWKR
jgi:hypothetical protein